MRYLQHRLGIDVPINPVEAGRLLLSAAETGEGTAQVAVANAYAGYRDIPGIILPEAELNDDMGMALYFWKRAADGGNRPHNLGH